MASNKPVIHGRDHLPGGVDPIPASPTTPIYFIGFRSSSYTDSSQTFTNGAADPVEFYHCRSNDDGRAYFTPLIDYMPDQAWLGDGTEFKVVKLLKTGLYSVTWQVRLPTTDWHPLSANFNFSTDIFGAGSSHRTDYADDYWPGGTEMLVVETAPVYGAFVLGQTSGGPLTLGTSQTNHAAIYITYLGAGGEATDIATW